MRTHIFLDANFILIPAQLNIDIYSEFNRLILDPYDLIVLSVILSELEKKIELNKTKTKLAQEFRLSKQILDHQVFKIINVEKKSNEYVDNILLQQAIMSKNAGDFVYIATNDKELRRKCRENKIRNIFIRNEKYLGVE